ncbi:hypothetical protein [Effusibacillus consociatus]|uniref:Uncharacterized protein n=1 Tax=Effusibacillus consociatus TaxID=1117041 RepID=A0ABV9Q2M4_9BACL
MKAVEKRKRLAGAGTGLHRVVMGLGKRHQRILTEDVDNSDD